MTTQQALGTYRSLIEQAMSNGMFKNLNSLDVARASLETLTQFVNSKNTQDGNGNEKSSDEKNGAQDLDNEKSNG